MVAQCKACDKVFDSHDGGDYYPTGDVALCPTCNSDDEQRGRGSPKAAPRGDGSGAGGLGRITAEGVGRLAGLRQRLAARAKDQGRTSDNPVRE